MKWPLFQKVNEEDNFSLHPKRSLIFVSYLILNASLGMHKALSELRSKEKEVRWSEERISKSWNQTIVNQRLIVKVYFLNKHN